MVCSRECRRDPGYCEIITKTLYLKVIDRLFLKGFIGPALLAFFIVEFVLVMQYLWKVIDDILGKGYGLTDYFELLLYLSVVLIPMALPLTILLSSVMVYGEMSEKYELSSMKTAGISLFRMMMPGLIVAVCVMLFSILASNVLKPEANRQFLRKIKAMKTNQLTFVFDEKIFNQEFKNYSIWIDRKDKDGRTIEGVLIYDHSDGDKSVINMIEAKRGEMYTVDNNRYLVMDLFDGYQVKEIRSESADQSIKHLNALGRPMARTSFSQLRKVFELSRLLNLNVSNVAGRDYEMMNSIELMEVIDSLRLAIVENHFSNIHRFSNVVEEEEQRKPGVVVNYVGRENVTRSQSGSSETVAAKSRHAVQYAIERGLEVDTTKFIAGDTVTSLIQLISREKKPEIIRAAMNGAGALKDRTFNKVTENKIWRNEIKKYALRLHQQYAWALVCLIFLFIGAPAGAIVRKGGFGFPLLIAIGFYMTFVITIILGEKLMRSGTFGPKAAAWLPCVILIPVAAYLTYKALNDRKLFEWQALPVQWLKRRKVS